MGRFRASHAYIKDESESAEARQACAEAIVTNDYSSDPRKLKKLHLEAINFSGLVDFL